MKTLQQLKEKIKKMRKPYDEMETFNYGQNPRPYNEYAYYSDLGYRSALDAVLLLLKDI